MFYHGNTVRQEHSEISQQVGIGQHLLTHLLYFSFSANAVNTCCARVDKITETSKQYSSPAVNNSVKCEPFVLFFPLNIVFLCSVLA